MNPLPCLTWLIVDGLPLWLLERFRHEHARLPNLARLWREGRIAGLQPVSPNCQTPPSLFSLLSGVTPAVHGLTGFDVPDREDPLALRNGFHAFARHVPMIWDRYAANGRSVRLCQMPYVDRARLSGALRGASYGFAAPVMDQVVLAAPDPGSIHALAGIEGSLAIVAAGASEIVVRVGGAGKQETPPVAVPLNGWVPLDLPNGLATLAGLVAIDGTPNLILLGAWDAGIHGDAPPSFPSAPFIAGGIARLYRRGRFARIAIDGGDGRAEAVLLTAITALGRRFWAEAIDAQARRDADLLVAYQPAYDLLFHEILGLIDETLAACEPGVVRRMEAILLRALADIDAGIAALVAGRGAERLIVSSDHGMRAVDSVLLPNVALRELGLLATRSDGSIDAFASAAFFHPAETGVVCFAPDRLAHHGLSMDAAMNALAGRLAQASGRACTWFAVDVPAAGPRGFVARHYLSPGNGQTAKAVLADRAVQASRKSADHATASDHPQLVGVVADLSAVRLPRWPASIPTEDVLTLLLEAA